MSYFGKHQILHWLVNQQNKEKQRLNNFGPYNKGYQRILGNINKD